MKNWNVQPRATFKIPVFSLCVNLGEKCKCSLTPTFKYLNFQSMDELRKLREFT